MPRRSTRLSQPPSLESLVALSEAKRPVRLPPPSRPPETGKFGTVENWQQFETYLRTLNSGERLHARWLAVNWLWYEALVRADLTPEESQTFTGALAGYRRRDHDYLLGLQRLPKYGIGLSGYPPHVRKALAVRELLVDLPMSGELDTLPWTLHIAVDLRQPDRLLLKDIAEEIRNARHKRQVKRLTESGKQHSLARLVEVLWLHDEKVGQDVKWMAAAWDAKTFRGVRGASEEIAKLCKRMLTLAREGQSAFVKQLL